MNGFDGAAEAALPGEMAAEPGLVAGTVTGYRWWALQAPDFARDPLQAEEHWPAGLLRGQVAEWQPGVNRAQCLPAPRHPEPAPFLPCGCGFYGYWELRAHDLGFGPQMIPVAGVIRASGRVLIGDLGFRAEKARILALCPAVEDILPEYDRMGWHDPYAPPTWPQLAAAERQSAGQAWAAVISDRLARMHPGARVFETVRAMQAVFPPDWNYDLRPGLPPAP